MKAFTRRILLIKKVQSGFSLIELLISVAIAGIIAAALAVAIFQLWHGQARSSGEMIVLRQVQQAGYYISRDTHMAREVLVDTEEPVDENDPDTIITLTWYWFLYHEGEPDRDGEGNRVIYILENDRLYRDYYFGDQEDPDTGEVIEDSYTLVSRTFIAEHIDDIDCSWNGNELKVTVTASVEGIAGIQAETRIYEAETRPNVLY